MDGETNRSSAVLGAAIQVHRVLGPGLLESAYRSCLEHELRHRGIPLEAEVSIPVRHRGVELDCSYRADFIVAAALVVEIKASNELKPIHAAQLLTYMRLLDKQVGLLIHFNAVLLRDGVRRIRLGSHTKSS